MIENPHCGPEIQPCELAIRLEERLGTAERTASGHASWLLRLDNTVNGLTLEMAREIAVLKTKLLFVSALGALVGSCVGAIVAGFVVYKITRG